MESEYLLKTILPIILTGMLSAYLTHYFAIRNSRLQRVEKAQFLALSIAFKLESFAVKCAKDEQLVKIQNNSEGALGIPKFAIPELETIEVNADFETLPSELLNSVLELVHDHDYSIDDANFCGFIEGDFSRDEAFEVHRNRLAHRAILIADRLRLHFDGRVRDLVFHRWDARQAVLRLKQY